MLSQNTLSLEKIKACYEQMLLIRRFEERAGQLYGQGLIGGFCHLYIGQEAVVVGIQAAQQPQDTVITSYRDHGHMLACDMDPKGVMAELTGRSGGYSKGKGGSMHMFSKEKNFFGGHGIVGAQISIGTGMAFAHKYKKDNGVCIAYMGDGAVNQGQVYESFNMAALWNLPIVYIVEDNKYAMGTSTHRGSANSDFSKRGEPYGIPSAVVDGMNLFDIFEKSTIAINHAREKGPYLLHVKTYRYRGHSMSDPAKYRSKEEVNDVKEHYDPIDQIKNHLIQNYKTTEAEFDMIDEKIKNIMLDVVNFAKTSPEPDEKELYTDILIGE
jgi:pyruvate dehydrogenase E1 component alpha subunit